MRFLSFRKINKLEAAFNDRERFQDLASELHYPVFKKKTKTQKLSVERMFKQLDLEEDNDFRRANEGISQTEETDESASDVDPEEALEKSLAESRIPLPICTICKQVMEDTFLYVPCGHAGCEDCLTSWRDASKTCHMCKRHVDMIIKLFPTETKTKEQLLLQQEQDQLVEETRQRREEQEQMPPAANTVCIEDVDEGILFSILFMSIRITFMSQQQKNISFCFCFAFFLWLCSLRLMLIDLYYTWSRILYVFLCFIPFLFLDYQPHPPMGSTTRRGHAGSSSSRATAFNAGPSQGRAKTLRANAAQRRGAPKQRGRPPGSKNIRQKLRTILEEVFY